MIRFSMAGETPDRTLAIYYTDGSNTTIPEDHPKFHQILETIIAGGSEETVRFLADLMSTVGQKLQLVSERVTYLGRKVFFDGDPIHGELVDVIRDLIEVGDPEELRPLVNFLEKTKTNPSQQSVDDLYRWITNGDLVIHEDGDFLAYKGVVYHRDDYNGEDSTPELFYSQASGEAFVDGQHHSGQIPQKIGSVVAMPRSSVDDNSGVGCSTGLHAGTHSYAQDYARKALLLVKINPRDVVSVPDDSSYQKLRVCRYEVLDVIEKKLESHAYIPDTVDFDDDEHDYDPDYYDGYEDEDDYDEEDDFEEPTDDEDNESYESDEALWATSGADDEGKDDEPEDGGAIPSAEMLEAALDVVDELQERFDAQDAAENAAAEEEPNSVQEARKLHDEIVEELAEKAEDTPQAIRDPFGRFTPESVQNAVRDRLGRFRGLKKD